MDPEQSWNDFEAHGPNYNEGWDFAQEAHDWGYEAGHSAAWGSTAAKKMVDALEHIYRLPYSLDDPERSDIHHTARRALDAYKQHPVARDLVLAAQARRS
jgi:hypothetical protein